MKVTAKIGPWLPFSISQSDQEEEQTQANGAAFHVTISPYDLPEAVRVIDDEHRGMVAIELKYISEGEPVKEREIDDGVLVSFGRTSGRLYKIELLRSTLEKQSRTYVLHALQSMEENLQNSARRQKWNLQVVERAMTDNWSKIKASLAEAGMQMATAN